MSSINLTRTEAEQRTALLTVSHYEVDLDLTGSDKTFKMHTTVHFEGKDNGETFIDARVAALHSVTLDCQDITPKDYQSNGIYFQVTPGTHVLKVDADCAYSRTGQGLHRFVDPADNQVYLYTQFETADAKRMFACFDQPDLKATYRFNVTAPADWKVITNAPNTVTATTADSGIDALLHSSHIDYPLSTYLVALCAGPYHEVRDVWQGQLTHHKETPADQPHDIEVPLGLYCRQSLAEHLDANTIFEQTKQGFDFFHANFGMAYPFGKYDQLFVPEFNMGAMENAGAVTFRDEYVFSSKVTRFRYERRCDTILHEMAHMWFGDLVTMQWWGDLWLNESFATWAAAISQAEATEFDTAWVTFANVEKSWAYRQDQLPSTHPVVSDASDIETVEQNFDGITYAKGASVLKQLQVYVGREAFFAGVRKHFATHAFGNATFDDLLRALEEASGRDLSDWANQWLKTTGINTLAANTTDDGSVYTSFQVLQRGAQPGAGELRTHRIAVGLYNLVGDEVVRTKQIELDIDGEGVEVPALVGHPVADLVLVNDDDLTYAIQELDPTSLASVIAHIAKITDPMARTLCWSAAWEMTRAGTMRARDFLALVARGAQYETEVAVLERVLAQAATAVQQYADPTWAQNQGLEDLSTMLLNGVENTSGDYQLAFLQALTKVRPHAEAAALLQELAAGRSPIADITVDEELRWASLTALIAAGYISEQDAPAAIAELGSEYTSATSRLAALRAAAAVNSDANKTAVYQEITTQAQDMSNLELRHKLEGLRFAGAGAHLQQHNESFYELAEDIWKNISAEVALVTLTGIYPGWDVSKEGIARAEAFLERSDLAGGLRRVIQEGMSDQVRALHNQEVDAGVDNKLL